MQLMTFIAGFSIHVQSGLEDKRTSKIRKIRHFHCSLNKLSVVVRSQPRCPLMRFTVEGALTCNAIHLSAPLPCAWQSKCNLLSTLTTSMPTSFARLQTLRDLSSIYMQYDTACRAQCPLRACMHMDVICITSSPFTLTNSSAVDKTILFKELQTGAYL